MNHWERLEQIWRVRNANRKPIEYVYRDLNFLQLTEKEKNFVRIVYECAPFVGTKCFDEWMKGFEERYTSKELECGRIVFKHSLEEFGKRPWV